MWQWVRRLFGRFRVARFRVIGISVLFQMSAVKGCGDELDVTETDRAESEKLVSCSG